MGLRECLLRTLVILFVVWVFIVVTVSYLQPPRSFLLILDASISMKDPLSISTNTSKMEAAKLAISRFSSSLGGEDRVGLIVFYDCDDIRLELPLGSPPEELMSAVSRVEPKNQAPIAGALRFADKLLRNVTLEGREYHVVLITDGVEYCGGDALMAAEDLWIHSGRRVRIDVISVMIPLYIEEVLGGGGIEGGPSFEGIPTGRKIPVRPLYVKMAEMTGGTFVDVRDADSFGNAMERIAESHWEVVKYHYWGAIFPLGLLICLGLRAREERWCVLRCLTLGGRESEHLPERAHD